MNITLYDLVQRIVFKEQCKMPSHMTRLRNKDNIGLQNFLARHNYSLSLLPNATKQRTYCLWTANRKAIGFLNKSVDMKY